MKRVLATALVAAQVLFVSGCSGGTQGRELQANQSAIFAPAPCPSAGEVDALSGIEGYAPGAGGAAKMGSGAQQSMGGLGGGLGGGSDATPTASPTTAPAGDCRAFTPRLTAALTKLAADRAKLPTIGYDVAARGALYTTPDAAFAFVRDAIRTDGYAGSMRGSRGTLNAEAGSPADKALLLRDLLSLQNVPTRLVHAPLAASDAAKVAALAATPVSTAAATVASGSGAVAAIAEGVTVAKKSLGTMTALLATRKLAIGGDDALAMLAANARDHWWLQAQIGGTWTDLDPTLPDAKMGDHLGPAPADAPVTALPSTVAATIAVRLLADAGGPSLQTLAETSATAADAFEAPITVACNGDANDLSAIATQTSFVPTVSIGATSASGSAFAPDGAAPVRAIYLESVATVPGRPAIVHRHVVVDRRSSDGKGIDPAWTPARTAYALTFAYRGVESVGDLDPAYALGVNIDAVERGALAANYAAQHPGELSVPDASVSDYPYEAHRFFGYDQSIRGAMSQADGSLAWIYDHPLIAFYRQGFDRRAGGLRLVQSFDIVDNAVLAISGGKLAGAPNAERGLMDTSVEGTLLSGPGIHVDTAAFFAAAKSQTLGVIGPSDVTSAPVAARDALTASLDATTVAIAPPSSAAIDGVATYGWLEVDTKTGNTVGRMESGAGQAMVDRAILEKTLEKYSTIKAIGRCLNCLFSADAAALDNAPNPKAFGTCMANALCQYAVDYTMDWFLIHGAGFDEASAIANAITGPLADAAGDMVGGGLNNAICDNILGKNPYSRNIIG